MHFTHTRICTTGEPNSEINKSANYPTCRLPLVETKKPFRKLCIGIHVFSRYLHTRRFVVISHMERPFRSTHPHPLPTRDRADIVCAKCIFARYLVSRLTYATRKPPDRRFAARIHRNCRTNKWKPDYYYYYVWARYLPQQYIIAHKHTHTQRAFDAHLSVRRGG